MLITRIKAIYIWVILFPFLLVSENLMFITIILLCSLFFLAGTNVLFIKKINRPINFIKLRNKKLFIIIPILFFFFKQEYIIETLQSLITGDFFQLSMERTRDRYDNNKSYGALFNIGTSLFFLFNFINGLSFEKNNVKRYIIIIFMVIIEISSLAKLSILIGGISFVIGHLLRFRHSQSKSKLKTFFAIPFGILFSLSLLMIVQFFRVKDNPNAIQILLFDKLPVYTIAHYKSFELWFLNSYEATSYGFGYYTFSSIFKLFGFKYSQGFYGFTNTPYGDTNIYTFFRNVFSDFPLPIVFILFFFLGMGLNNIRKNSVNYLDIFIFMVCIPFVLFPFNSLFIFTTYLLFTIMAMFVMKITN
jgi:oligosaccharide repeat unit polymerase